MSKLVIIIKNFVKCDTPTCVACIYAKSTCKRWRERSRKTPHKSHQITNRGQKVSVDHILSQTPRLVENITGILNTKRYEYATVGVYHFSIYTYIHLHQTN